jgi:phosphoribosyl 1,2-cyclic phosphodiesterase
MQICTLASGSSGNAALVQSGDTAILVDAGLSALAIAECLRIRGLAPDAIRAVCVTHEHGDHIRGAGAFARRFGVPVYASAGTLRAAAGQLGRMVAHAVDPGEFRIGGLRVTAIPISHDTAEPVCYRFDADGASVAVATDMGRVDDDVLDSLDGVQAMVWESNHDPDMLWNGPYPAHLKARISGGKGHLPNEQSATALRELARGGLQQVILAHLSETNNTPLLALAAAHAALGDLASPPVLHVAPRFSPSDWLVVR